MVRDNPLRVAWRRLCGVLGAAWLAWSTSVVALGQSSEPSSRSILPESRTPLTAGDQVEIGATAARWFREGLDQEAELPAQFVDQSWVAYLAARNRGRRVAHAWGVEARGRETLRSAVGQLRQSLGEEGRAAVTALEIDLAHSFVRADRGGRSLRWSNAYRGLLGIELRRRGRPWRMAPTQMIAQNCGFDRALERLRIEAGEADGLAGSAQEVVSLFEAHQMLVLFGGPGPRTIPLYRGNTIVPIEAVTRPAVANLSSNLARWLTTNLKPDGRMVYQYWPSRGEESANNNEIRQWMATLALTRLARWRDDPALRSRVAGNVRYNLARSYRWSDSGLGQIVEKGSVVKLGALALACLALGESPRPSDFAAEQAGLRRTIDHLWQANGEFRTFLVPASRTDNVNFYPGEALLLWAALHARSKDGNLLDRILTSVAYYRDWHRANRNPAFVPWHTQACFLVWKETRSPEIRDWIFEMNDWLLGIQQWESQREFPDTQGRFHAPDRPFGPPHASSTGVYLEGLVDAWRLAHECGDAARQERYRTALIRGLRSVLQLTFRHEVDLFYVSRRDPVLGGVRTTVFDNTIRVDNVQHNLMAILNLLEHLPPADFRP